MTDAEAREGLSEAVLYAINANRALATKWRPLYDWFHDQFGLEDGVVAAKLLTENKQLSNRIKKELPQLEPKYAVLCAIGDDFDLKAVERHLAGANLPRANCVLLLEGTTPAKLLVYQSDGVSERLASITGLSPTHTARPTTGAGAAAPPLPATVVLNPTAPIVLDARVRRMVLLTIMSTPAVILVGPPGTGKSSLLREILDEIRSSPTSFGFTADMPAAKWVTPEESWTTTDLVGGETVFHGELRFRPGHVLEAIRENRWLVLDETNRADMDKIFGGLLTWLEGQPVDLGRATKALSAPPVRLEWGTEAECTYSNLEALDGLGTEEEAVRFVAGTEWRLLGTYNALDAQRVFRFGQAIGRRFARVPIPTPEVDEFARALVPFAQGLASWISEAIVELYAAHKESAATELGPALFLRIPAYVRAAIDTPDAAILPASDLPGMNSGDENPTENSEPAPPVESNDDGATALAENLVRALIAEGYLVNVGSWLARLETSELEALAARVVVERSIFSLQEWTWLQGLVRFLG